LEWNEYALMAQIENVKSCTIVKETKNYTVQKIIKILKIIFKHKKRHALQAHGNKSRDGHARVFFFFFVHHCVQAVDRKSIYISTKKQACGC
jgi:hypothetical protein